MFTVEVKNIHQKADIVKVQISNGAEMLEKLTVVVVEDVGWHGPRIIWRKGGLQERLEKIRRSKQKDDNPYIYTRNSFRTKEHSIGYNNTTTAYK